MPKNYCYQCAISNDLISPIEVDPVNLTGTSYQLEKYIKHTISPSQQGLITIFGSSDYQIYQGYIVTGTISGMLEIDDRGCKNFIWYGGDQTGFEYSDGEYIAPVSGAKIVYPEDNERIHAFPVSGISGLIYNCDSCGRPIPQW